MRIPLIAVLMLALLGACSEDGSGEGGSSAVKTPPDPVTMPSDFVLQYPGPQVFTVNAPGSSDVPVLSYTGLNKVRVTPALPAGLRINADTGVISGTPTTITAAASYKITVSNEAGGLAQASVVLEVTEGPFFYPSPITLDPGSAMTPLSPRGASGTANYSVTPELPHGLSIDPASGVISGTPAAAQPATYYQVSRDTLATRKFGLTLSIGTSTPPAIAVSAVSTLNCAYSGGFTGTYVGNSKPNDEGLIAIAFLPDGIAMARVLDLSDSAVYDSDGLSGLSANLDGSFEINFPASGAIRQIRGNYSGADLISGTYESEGIARPFQASRLAGAASAAFRYTGGFGSSNGYRIDFGALDITGNTAAGMGYQFGAVGSDYRLINRQLVVQGTFSGNTLNWSVPDDGIAGVNNQSNTGLQLSFGDPYDALFFARTVGCRLN
jgi:hypothetical protein